VAKWMRVTRSEVERMARFPSIAAQNALSAAKEYSRPEFMSLHIGAFAVMERSDLVGFWPTRTKARRRREAASPPVYVAIETDSPMECPICHIEILSGIKHEHGARAGNAKEVRKDA
jgi:hypothetical protein